jgi:hypothetical protein
MRIGTGVFGLEHDFPDAVVEVDHPTDVSSMPTC